MKKRLLTVLLLVCLAGTAGAQELHYGIKADLNMFKLDGAGIKSNYTLGGRLGVYAEYDFSKKWGLQPELLFSQVAPKRGDDFSAKYIHTSNDNANKTIKLSYITLPLLLRYNVNKLITVNAGPQYSFLFYDNENLLTYDRNAFKRSDFGVAAGATLTFDILHVYARYVLGLTNVNDIDDRYQWKTRQAQIGIGVNIK
ncbi:porin family protein [Chitinophaga polysaccharea]|uniref:porin family protein n=1 Tax=Chitinophaga polysaccharea TaxID=1293035 RepID=UPI001159AFA9|nr:porin family protein [Chitinophaga polysaccharea]